MFSPKVKHSVGAILNHLGFLDTYASLRSKRIGSQVAILWYHRVTAKKDQWSYEALDPRVFEEQMRYLHDNYEILSLEELVRCLYRGTLLHRKSVCITLDDGYRDNYLYAYPVLRKYNMPATIFLTSGHVGTGALFWWDKVAYAVWHARVGQLGLPQLGSYRLESGLDRRRAVSAILDKLKRMPDQKKNSFTEELVETAEVDIPDRLGEQFVLSWDEVLDMSRNGVDFGGHTVSHPILVNMPADQANREIVHSKKVIETVVGKPVHFFAYPDGSYNPQVVEMVKDAGFHAACTCDPNWINSMTNPYECGRVPGCDDFDLFKFLLSGLWRDLQSVLRRESQRIQKDGF